MPGERIVFDGLWRCLCPSVDITTLSRLIEPLRSPPRRPVLSSRSHTSITDRQSRRGFRRVATGALINQQPNNESVEEAHIQYLKRIAKRSPWIPGVLFGRVGAFATKLDTIPTKTIYTALRELSNATGTYSSTITLIEYLITERKERPNVMLYESLIRANVDRNHGSAAIAGQLLEEMEKLQIPITPQIYQALLEVTAVHPDYVLRNKVLFEMRNRWQSQTSDSLINIIIGLLRDNQYELALERLEEMHKDPVTVPTWLYDVFLYVFGDLGFHDETLSILKHRFKVANISHEPLSPNVWQFLLDVFSRDAYYEGIKYIWDRSVSRGDSTPPDGVITNIVNAAANHMDATLAISAIQMLSNRGRKLELHHYEPLVDIHVHQGDIRRAFMALCIMAKAGLRPDLSSTRSIFRVLRESSEKTDNAMGLLDELRSQRNIPIAAFNVVLEATKLHHGFKTALDLYRSVRRICDERPDLETYHILFAHCTMRKSMNFLFAEMEAFSIQPTQTTYNHLIRISCLQDNYEQAFQFLEKMKTSKTAGISNNWWMGKASALALIRRCIQAEDIRAQELIEECRRRGISIDAEVEELLERVQKLREHSEVDAGAAAEETSPTEPSRSVQSPKLGAMESWA
ncbi:uncharacterized protein F4822DRAFT_416959 [Hypoxylon trugodes]|uniref:uncharacterized protein n=1 Tax=Hypoxylon trugodes TaxID=326681 RepID=UPI0021953820|nr:uncharacterized protein F4822DRAFT_416959 [Hypoxylon trugodes]KAI1384995.1 hypothetical protein F4822DRAFT_416959 [Hypoxylon trugodes]